MRRVRSPVSTLRTRLADLRAAARRLEDEGAALAVAARDPRTPWDARAVAVVAYVLSSLDPVLGLLDETLVVPPGVGLALRLTRRRSPPRPASGPRRARRRGRARWVVAGVALWAGAAWPAWRAVAG